MSPQKFNNKIIIILKAPPRVENRSEGLSTAIVLGPTHLTGPIHRAGAHHSQGSQAGGFVLVLINRNHLILLGRRLLTFWSLLFCTLVLIVALQLLSRTHSDSPNQPFKSWRLEKRNFPESIPLAGLPVSDPRPGLSEQH